VGAPPTGNETMARIEYFDMNQATPALKRLVDSRPALNIYRMLGHGGAAAEGMLALGTALLRNNELDEQWRELVIVRVGLLCRSAYEVHQHKRLAAKVGVSEEKIAALEDGPDAAVFDEDETRLLRFTDQVVLGVKSGPSLFEAVRARLSSRALVELQLTIGYYMMVCRLLENFEVDLEQQPPAIDSF
jgi:alkylhydroperoxidase family enzyme